MLLRFLSFQNLLLEEQHGLERCYYSHFFSEKSENYMRAPLFSDNFAFVEVRYQIKIFCVKFHHKNILKCSYFCKKCIRPINFWQNFVSHNLSFADTFAYFFFCRTELFKVDPNIILNPSRSLGLRSSAFSRTRINNLKKINMRKFFGQKQQR